MNEITKPYPSWVWDEPTLSWVTPNGKEVPGNGKPHTWDEATLNWIEVPQQ